MLVSYRQPLGHRQPLRVSRLLYWRLWLGYCLDQLGAELRPARQALGRWWRTGTDMAARAARLVGTAVDRVRPHPMTDGGLLAMVIVVALAALTLASGIGYGVAQWMLTAPEDALLANAAVVVGVLLLLLLFVVFGAKREYRPRSSREGNA